MAESEIEPDLLSEEKDLEIWAMSLDPNIDLVKLTYDLESRAELLINPDLAETKKRLQRLHDLRATSNESLNSRRIKKIRSQSDVEMKINNTSPPTEVEQTMKVVGGEVLEEHDEISDDLILNVGQTEIFDLNEFLARPTELTNFALTLGTHTSVVVPIWDLKSLEPSI